MTICSATVQLWQHWTDSTYHWFSQLQHCPCSHDKNWALGHQPEWGFNSTCLSPPTMPFWLPALYKPLLTLLYSPTSAQAYSISPLQGTCTSFLSQVAHDNQRSYKTWGYWPHITSSCSANGLVGHTLSVLTRKQWRWAGMAKYSVSEALDDRVTWATVVGETVAFQEAAILHYTIRLGFALWCDSEASCSLRATVHQEAPLHHAAGLGITLWRTSCCTVIQRLLVAPKPQCTFCVFGVTQGRVQGSQKGRDGQNRQLGRVEGQNQNI